MVTQVINGWQKFEYEVQLNHPNINPNLSFEIEFSVPGGSQGFYLDDIRIQPFNSTMSAMVYDPSSLRLCAVLDDRNFAKIMEYDQEGVLVRTKKETLNGLYTISETRESFKK
jgi:hypothetical protein